MPLKSGKLTPQERAFVGHMSRTNDATYAAEKAGYAHPVHAGSNIMRRDVVKNEVLKRQRERIETEGVTMAVDFTLMAIQEERFPPGVRLNAAKLMLDHAFRDATASDDKQAHEMSPDELAKAIADAKLRAAALEHVAADRAKPIIEHDKPDILA